MFVTKPQKKQAEFPSSNENKKFYDAMKNLLPTVVSECFQIKGGK